ncbi:MAG TPA: glycosyltransferase family 2 protein [Patescibacteria group bacterium]|nr:glycosyltransferase family 2 protein [Patescibacteria group bacterium]
MSKAVVIIPTYKERENIERIIPIIEEDVFPQVKNYQMFILVADDNSPDGTPEAVEAFAKKYKNIEISSGEKKGLGAAYIRAMTFAIEEMGADVVFEMDADLQHDPAKIPDFLEKIDEGCDMVIGTRYSDGGSIPAKWPLHRKAFSVVANLFVRTVFMRFYIHDWTGGYRALKKEVFLKEKHELTKFSGYIFQISFLHKAVRDGFKIGEVPFHFGERSLGDSKIAPIGYIMQVITFVITTRITELQRVIKFLIVGGTGFIVQLVFQEFAANVLFVSVIASLRDGLSAGFGAEAAILCNFMFNNFWTFSDTKHIKQNSHFMHKLIKFNLATLLSVFIQFLSVYLFVHFLGEDVMLFGMSLKTRIVVLFPTIILLVIPLNYFIYNRIIWKTHHLKDK